MSHGRGGFSHESFNPLESLGAGNAATGKFTGRTIGQVRLFFFRGVYVQTAERKLYHWLD